MLLPKTPMAWRAGALAYWGTFAGWSLWAARIPSFAPDYVQPPYPWHSVLWVWAILAGSTGGLMAILCSTKPRAFGARLLLALLVSGVFALEEVATVSSDQAGCYYVPGEFWAITTCGLLMWTLARAIVLPIRVCSPNAGGST
jgi:hypothetical protein